MTMIKQAFIELLFLTVASVGVALAANAVRERKPIELTKNYFSRHATTPPTSVSKPLESNVPPSVVPVLPSKPASAPPKPEKPADSQNAAPPKHLEHEFQKISLGEVTQVFDDPQTKQGLNIFVDARDEEHFAEGHIPGALQCFHYEAKRCLDRVKNAANGAEKVIVYCGGGDCEDSIFMSQDLIEAGVPSEAIFLFEGGWKEWVTNGMPVEGGK